MPTSVLGTFSFAPGKALVDGGDLAQMASILFSTKVGIVARAGGGQANATPLSANLNQIDTVATTNDSVMLPPALPGSECWVYNASGNTLAVFGQVSNPNTGAGDTIAANNSNTQQATGTGVTQATAVVAVYKCFAAGKWKQLISA